MKKTTAAWVRKAEADYAVAAQVARGSEPLHDAVCFHCQQCAEKYLKALLVELGLTVPRTHLLLDLRRLLLPHYPTLRPYRRGLDLLTRFAVDFRYPGRNATKRQSVATLHWAGRVRAEARGLLGTGLPRRRKTSP